MYRFLNRIAALSILLPLLSAADWPVFRGNALQDGVSTDKLPDRLVERWQFKAGDSVEGAAAIVDGVVYVGSFDQHFYAIDLATGKQKWKYKAGPYKCPAAVLNGRVYAGDLDGKFVCLDAAKGDEVWKFQIEAQISAGAAFSGDRVIFGTDDESLLCLDGKGKKVWQFKVPGGPVLASPAVANNSTFVAGCDSKMHVINVKTGEEIDAIDIGGQTGATPAARGDIVYVGTQNSQLLAVDLKKKDIVWTFEPESRKQPFNSSAAVTEKYVVVGCQNKRVYCLDRKSGKEVWAFVTEGRVDGSPVIVGERVYIGSQDGNLYVIDLKKGTEVQRLKLDDAIASSPAVSNGCLVIGTMKGTVYCFGAKE